MEQEVLSRHPIHPPDPGDLSAALVARLVRASAGLAGLTPVTPARVMAAPSKLLEPLRHSLSGAYLARNGTASPRIRAEAESAVLDRLGPTLDPADRAGFASALAAFNADLAGRSGGWRRAGVGTAPDAHGNRIAFPAQAHVAGQIERTRKLLDRRDAPAIFKAAMALALLTNCHPFRDGNGRVARLVFNHTLRAGGMPRSVYVAFSEFAGRSDGGYLIALRQGELRGQWEQFLEFVMTMIDVHRCVARWDAARADV